MTRATVAVVVPAYNEEKVIETSLRLLSKVINQRHIYVVSDGSGDKTAGLAQKVTSNVLNLRKNRGKAVAIKLLTDRYMLTKRYRYIFFFDADTRITSNFLVEISKVIKSQQPALIVGTVGSNRGRLISAYRVYEYGFSHLLFKNAQNVMGTIIVAPGCASIYRSDVFDQLSFNNHTLTEDLDLTMQIHKKKLGKIVYCRSARVITQDPETLRDYWNQINRWNTGFWQNFFLHKLYLPNRRVNFEVLLSLADLTLWLLILSLAVTRPLYFLTLYGLAFVVSTVLGVAVTVISGQYWAIPYSPLFGLFQVINLGSLVYSFFRAVFSSRTGLTWQKVNRYSLG